MLTMGVVAAIIMLATCLPLRNPEQGQGKGNQLGCHCCGKKISFSFGTLIEIFVGIALIVVGYLQFSVYTRQAGIMDQQTLISQAEHRPWVSANPIDLLDYMPHGDSGLQMTIQFTLKNTGHSPARRAFPGVTPFLQYASIDAWKQVCDQTAKGRIGVAIFPNDTIVQSVGINFSEGSFVARKEDADKNNGGKIPSILQQLVACIVLSGHGNGEIP